MAHSTHFNIIYYEVYSIANTFFIFINTYYNLQNVIMHVSIYNEYLTVLKNHKIIFRHEEGEIRKVI